MKEKQKIQRKMKGKTNGAKMPKTARAAVQASEVAVS
jgi:hypothetical protein